MLGDGGPIAGEKLRKEMRSVEVHREERVKMREPASRLRDVDGGAVIAVPQEPVRLAQVEARWSCARKQSRLPAEPELLGEGHIVSEHQRHETIAMDASAPRHGKVTGSA